MSDRVASNNGAGVIGWQFKPADEIQVGEYAFLLLNIPCRVLAKFEETTAGSRVSLIRFQIEGPYGGSLFVARLASELVVYEIRKGENN